MKKLVLILFVVFLLSACIPTGFTPEEAARRAVVNNPSRSQVVPETLVMHQSQSMGKETYVLFTFQQLSENRVEDCLFLYAVRKSPIGTWVPAHGGGGCSGEVIVLGGDQVETPPTPLLEVGGGMSSGESGDPGSTQSYGKVNNDAIVTVRATWADGVANEVEVINSSFLIVRSGEHNMPKLEALDANGTVLFTQEPPVGAGKEP